MFTKISIAAAVAASSFVALPAAAEAQYYDRYESSRYDRGYYNNRDYRDYRSNRNYGRNGYYGRNRNYYGRQRCSGTTGTIVGAVAGGLLGREIGGRGDRTVGTIIGGAAGALAGRAIDKGSCRR